MAASNGEHGEPETTRDTFQRLLVPLDGSRLAEAAVPPAISIARGAGATVALLHVIEAAAPERVHGEVHLATAADATRYLEGVRVRVANAGVPVTIHVHDQPKRDVAGAIIAHAGEFQADLIVLASHGSGGIRGFLFGRVARQVVRRGRTPALMVQVNEGDDPDQPFTCQRIALALSGTREAEAALEPAVRLAHATSSTIHLIAAVPTATTLPAERAAVATLLPTAAREVLDLEAEATREYLGRLATAIEQRGIRVTYAVVRGDPARATVTEAHRVAADVLALATHGQEGLRGMWSGSVGAKILSQFRRPLLLVPVPGHAL